MRLIAANPVELNYDVTKIVTVGPYYWAFNTIDRRVHPSAHRSPR
jgi:hypothetical protein